MAEPRSDLRRIVVSTGVYATAAIAQRGLAFFLLPLYTRYIDPAQYGVLELLNAFAAVVFAVLAAGLPSAINKCYHRDSPTPEDRRSLLPTALLLDLPVLLVAGLAFALLARPLGRWLTGAGDAGDLVLLVVANGIVSTLAGLVLASLRAEERAVAFGVLSLAQLVPALVANLVLVAGLGMGVRGVLLGNLLGSLIALPAALLAVRHRLLPRFNRRLVRPLLSFGLLLVPVMLSGWVIDLSDRYLLRLFRDLGEVAVYGVGYKIGMVVQLAVVWPFQLSWPAVSFSISHRDGHRRTYARALTYLVLVLAAAVVGLSLGARVAVPGLVGPGYAAAFQVVPLVALGYAFNGIFYCVSPGIHLAGRTRRLSLFSWLAALVNVGLNLLLLPRLGMIGAALSTAVAFGLLAAATLAQGQRVYRVEYETGRLARIAGAAVAVYAVGVAFEPASRGLALAWDLGMGTLALPAVLLATGFLDAEERAALRGLLSRLTPAVARRAGSGSAP